MIGDFFGGGRGTLDIYYWSSYYGAYCPCDVFFPSPGAVLGATKIAENTSPLPQDRIFFNYSYFDNTPLYPGGVNVSRFTPGVEKTFCCGTASLEVRVPMAVTLDSMIVLDDGPDLSHGEFGNLALTPKLLLRRRRRCALSAGMTITVPTADDVNGVLADGTHLARIENEAVHLMPFVGWLWTPNPCFFAHGFFQYDVATNGNPVAIDRSDDGLEHVGYLNDTAFQYLDVGIGYWAYRTCAPVRCSRLRSIALTAELHWNKSLQEGDYIEQEGGFSDGDFLVGNTATNVDVWDAAVGMHVRLCDTTISLAYITPIGGGADQPFDGEFRLTLNRWFGRSSQAYGYGAYPGIFP
jgi:hypothetical protein